MAASANTPLPWMVDLRAWIFLGMYMAGKRWEGGFSRSRAGFPSPGAGCHRLDLHQRIAGKRI
jgi:hypothetical protein